MKVRLSLLCAALLFVSIAHRATDYRKMSGHVKGIVVKQEQKVNATRSLIPHTSHITHQPSRLTAFVRIDGADADEVWSNYGCKPYAHFGDNYIVGIPLDAVGALSDHPAVRRIEASPSGFLTMDTTAIIIGAIWGLWHMPLILMGHNFPDHPVIGVFVMTIACICLAPIVQFIRLKSGSVVAAAIFHGSFNAFGTFIPLFFEHTDDLLSGPMGLAGIVTSIVGLGVLHLTDRRILSSTI